MDTGEFSHESKLEERISIYTGLMTQMEHNIKIDITMQNYNIDRPISQRSPGDILCYIRSHLYRYNKERLHLRPTFVVDHAGMRGDLKIIKWLFSRSYS